MEFSHYIHLQAEIMSESGVDERIWVENNSQAYRVAYEVVERTTSILSPNFKQKVQDEMYR